jgi:mRNA-degrading endonuclease RelE of RelBE toxin-antitoxin system
MTPYELQVSGDVRRQLQRCRASIRATIQQRLEKLVEDAASPAAGLPPSAAQGPPLRFYVFEGYRVTYRVDALTRRVVVLELLPDAGSSA